MQISVKEKDSNFSQKFFNDELIKRQRKNSSYSLRALARDLGISKTTIHDVLNNGRKLSNRTIQKLKASLNLDDKIVKSLKEDRLGKSNQGRVILLDDEFSLIKDWHYLAILNLAKLKENFCNASWVAARLAITFETAEKALGDLLKMGLIENRKGKIYRTSKALTTSVDIPSESIKEHHRQSLVKAIDALEEVSVDLRDYTSVTYAINPADLKDVKKLTTKFHRKLGKFLPTKNATEVYRLNIQFFPLTKNVESKNE